MSSIDVRVFAFRRRPGRAAFEVRWQVAGRLRSRSFMTRALADSFRAELVRAARKGAGFDPATGEPAAWAVRHVMLLHLSSGWPATSPGAARVRLR